MGITVSLDGNKIVYDSFDPGFRELQHEKWQIVFDECDLSCILAITEDNKRRFVLDRKRALPMDVHSMTADDHLYRSQINNFNKQRMERVIETYITDNATVAQVMSSTPLSLTDYDEASIKLMFTSNGQQKETLQDAKGLKRIQEQTNKAVKKELKAETNNWLHVQEEYLNSKNDFNQYLD